jgi:hypothetical protein
MDPSVNPFMAWEIMPLDIRVLKNLFKRQSEVTYIDDYFMALLP